VIVHVLRNVVFDSVRSVHNFALVCKRFLLLTRAQSIWRPLCEHVYHTHNIPKEISDQFQLDIVNRAYNGNWLRMFIERPRIRFEGIYIATCHYLRPGISDTAWNQPIHLVTYYRYLRFFPDGTMIKYLSTDEPIHVVRNITKHFKAKQVFHGRYEIEGDKVIVHMRDQETRPTERFQMNVNIKSTHRGRHNKLAWEEYVSWSDVRGDKTNYNLKHMKPYYFSVVRSYIVD
jgi:F-box protein 9